MRYLVNHKKLIEIINSLPVGERIGLKRFGIKFIFCLIKIESDKQSLSTRFEIDDRLITHRICDIQVLIHKDKEYFSIGE
jgi:hypothetical protein